MPSKKYLSPAHTREQISELLDQVFWKFNVDARLIKSYLCLLPSVAIDLIRGFHLVSVIINLSQRAK